MSPAIIHEDFLPPVLVIFQPELQSKVQMVAGRLNNIKQLM